MCHCTTAILVLVVSIVAGLFLGLRPAHNYSVANKGRIALDHDELAVPKHPQLVTSLNYIVSSLPPAWQRFIVPLDLNYLMAKAASQASVLLSAAHHPEKARKWKLLSFNQLQAVSPTHVLEGWKDDSNILTGLRALLYDLDGDPTLHESRPMGVATVAFDEGAGYSRLSFLGRFATQQQIIGAIKNQMILHQLLIAPIEGQSIRNHCKSIQRPIIIVGAPRTGTTFLHRALSTHHQAKFLPYFEALAGTTLEFKDIGSAKDPRVHHTNQAMKFIHLMRPLFSKMMVMGAKVPFEDMQLSAHCFSSLLWESTVGYTPKYSKWYRTSAQEFGYRCIKLFLAAIEHQRHYTNKTTWVLKTPQHSLHLQSIKKIFPEAVIVMTFRKSKDILRSLLPLLSYSAGVQNERVDLHKFGKEWVDRLSNIIAQQKKHAGLFPRSIPAQFEAFIQTEESQM